MSHYKATHDNKDSSSPVLLSEKEACKILGFSVRTLQTWRVDGGGPTFVKISARAVRYRRCDLNAWIESRLCQSTAEGYRAN